MFILRRFLNLFITLIFANIIRRNNHNISQRKHIIIAFPWWVLQLLFAVFDLILLGEFISFLVRITNKNRRKVGSLISFNHLENEKIYIQNVTIIEQSWLAKWGCKINKSQQLGLGIANTIHFSRKLNFESPNDIHWVYHELAHTLQWKYRGLIYIPEALIAQRFSGYHFGGNKILSSNRKLRAFNPEQQAEIFRELFDSKIQASLMDDIVLGKW